MIAYNHFHMAINGATTGAIESIRDAADSNFKHGFTGKSRTVTILLFIAKYRHAGIRCQFVN
jgi:hypothetical protein